MEEEKKQTIHNSLTTHNNHDFWNITEKLKIIKIA